MSPPVESSLLRLAIAKGFLRWEDLDAVAEHLPADGGNGEVSPFQGRWVRALVEAGLLQRDDVERLSTELAAEREDLTPDLSGGSRPWPELPPAAEAPVASPF